MITIWADQMAMGLMLAQFALAGGVAINAMLRVPGREHGLAATLKVMAFMTALAFLPVSQLIDPLLAEAHSGRTWALVGFIGMLDMFLVVLGLSLASAAKRARDEVFAP